MLGELVRQRVDPSVELLHALAQPVPLELPEELPHALVHPLGQLEEARPLVLGRLPPQALVLVGLDGELVQTSCPLRRSALEARCPDARPEPPSR